MKIIFYLSIWFGFIQLAFCQEMYQLVQPKFDQIFYTDFSNCTEIRTDHDIGHLYEMVSRSFARAAEPMSVTKAISNSLAFSTVWLPSPLDKAVRAVLCQ